MLAAGFGAAVSPRSGRRRIGVAVIQTLSLGAHGGNRTRDLSLTKGVLYH